MDTYKLNDISQLLESNTYPGRGIIIGTTPDGKKSVTAYFIMGRSENSRNRIFEVVNGNVFTKPFDESKVKDPRLIIYQAVGSYGNHLVVTNGDQTGTILNGLARCKTFSQSLESRTFEPDKPNFTPRISGILTFATNGTFKYQMSILKSIDEAGSDCARYTYSYNCKPGTGHFIHTYMCDGNPIPSFQGEPERISIDSKIDTFTDRVWSSLNEDNKVSLYVCYTDLKSGRFVEKIMNKNKAK